MKNSELKNFKRGTPGFGILCGAALAILGGMIMWIGFWRTLLLAALFAVGYFLGGIEDKTDFVKSTVDRVVPEKKEETIDFRREIEKDQREAQRAAMETKTETAQEDEE